MATKSKNDSVAPEVNEEVTTKEKEAKKPAVDPMEEYVEIELFKDSGKYSGDVYVSVNGENCIVKRGVPVKIKRKFYEVIRQSMYQDKKTAEAISQLTK